MIVHTTPFCTYAMNVFFIFEGVKLDIFPFKMIRQCLVCVICNSKQFPFLYIQTLHNNCSHTEDVLLVCAPFDNIVLYF